MSISSTVLDDVKFRENRVGDPSFRGLAITQFLGAFNDNFFKQLMLLLAIPVASGALDQQQVATVVYALPFVLFSGIAGFLSDRYSKRSIIVIAKATEIGIAFLGLVGFCMYGMTGYTGLLLVLFLMGVHSAFFGPCKYGILPDLVPHQGLPRANAIILMTTFLAIIFGTVSAGVLGDWFIDKDRALSEVASKLWIGSAICVGIAIAGYWTSIWISPVLASHPDLKLQPSSWAISMTTVKLLMRDRQLVISVMATSVFWLVSGIAIQAVNSLGVKQLHLSLQGTSTLAAVIGLGIAGGSMLASRLSSRIGSASIVRYGIVGIFLTLAVMAISWPSSGPHAWQHMLGYYGALPVLTLLGVSAGLFVIPLQVFLQSRPPENQRGRMIAAMNLSNYIAIVLSGFVYGIFDRAVTDMEGPRSLIFGWMSLLILPLVIWYHPNFASAEQTLKRV